MEILKVNANGNEFDYFSFGQGNKNFIIIPGLSLKSVMLSADAIAQSYSQFSRDYTVYVFDRAKNLKAGYTVEDMADDLAQAMIKLGIEDAYIFGASQGGMIAQIIAIKYPNLVQKLVVGSSAARLSKESLTLIEQWISYAQNEDVVSLNHSFFVNVYSKELLESLGDTLKELEKDGTSDEMKRFVISAGACRGFDIYNDLDNIKCSVLVLGAKDDKVLGANASVEIAKKLNCELYMFDGGHAAYDEAPDYKDKIITFFEK